MIDAHARFLVSLSEAVVIYLIFWHAVIVFKFVSEESQMNITLPVVIASYIENRRDTPHGEISLPSGVPDAPEELKSLLWDDCFANHEKTLEYLFDLQQDDCNTIMTHRENVSKKTLNALLQDTVGGRPVSMMDMHDIIASVTLFCTANVVLTSETASMLAELYPSGEEQERVRELVTRGYMSDAFAFFLAMSEGAVANGLREFKEKLRSLPDEIDKLVVSKKDEKLSDEALSTLCEVGYVILGSLEKQHYDHINAYMEEMRDKIKEAQLSAIRLRDFANAPPPPIKGSGDCFDGLFTLWFWYNAKLEYIIESLSS